MFARLLCPSQSASRIVIESCVCPQVDGSWIVCSWLPAPTGALALCDLRSREENTPQFIAINPQPQICPTGNTGLPLESRFNG
jgi:hypothetical protein